MYFEKEFLVLIYIVVLAETHLTVDKGQLSALKSLCEHAYACFHDKVIICGKSVNEARTFIDLCDMFEYSCEYSMVKSYGSLIEALDFNEMSNQNFKRHVKDDEYCPNQKELGFGVG